MLKRLAQLAVDKSEDYNDKVIKALENAGFVLVLEMETSTDKYCIIAEREEKNDER